MKSKYIIAIVCCVLIVSFLLGFTGVVNLSSYDAGNEQGRFVGVFVTFKALSLYDENQFMVSDSDSIINGSETYLDTSNYEGRLYGTLIKETEVNSAGEEFICNKYDFDGVDGISFFVTDSTFVDPCLNDVDYSIVCGEMFGETTEPDELTIKGTLTVDPNYKEEDIFMNPVYQTSDGAVYVTQGDGFSLNNSGSVSVSEEYKTSNGDSETTKSVTVSLNFEVGSEAEEIELLQFSESGVLLDTSIYDLSSFPDTIETPENTDYIILVSKYEDKVTRELYQRESDSLLSIYKARDYKIIQKQYSDIIWN